MRPSAHPVDRQLVTDRLAEAASTRNLYLALLHAFCAGGIHLALRGETGDHRGDPLYAVLAILVPAAVLAVTLYGVSALWRLGRSGADRVLAGRPVQLGARARGGLLLVVLAALVLVTARVWPALDLFVWVIGGLWVASAAALLLLRRLPGEAPRWPWDGLRPVLSLEDVVADATAGAWTAALLLELIFHTAAAHFMDVRDIVAFVHTMSAEAEAMLLGPEAWTLAGLVAAYLVAFAVAVRIGRHRPVTGEPRGRPLLAYGALVVLGLGAWAWLPGTARPAVLHHVHPTVAGLASLAAAVAPDPAAADAGQAAARALYPERLAELDRRPLPRAVDAATWAAGPRHAARARNVVLVFIDALSRRHLEAYGYTRQVAPNLARLARAARRFTQARSNGGHTDLATVALLYGLQPYLHASKAEDYAHGHGGLPVHLLAQAAGWRAGVFSADWETATAGYAPMFPDLCDAFLDARRAEADPATSAEVKRWAGLREDRVVDAFSAWYRPLHAAGQPFFGYVKFLRPHAPYYTPPAGTVPGWAPPYLPAADGYGITDFHPAPERVEPLRNRYDNAIAFTDQQLGRLLADLEASGAARDTAVVLLSDHGEAWGEHGLWSHGMHLYEEMIEVPLLLRLPGEAAAVDDRQVSTVDVAPTLLDVLGLPPHPAHQGQSLLDPDYRPDRFLAFNNTAADLAALQVGDWKLIEDLGTGETWLYHRGRDPGEKLDLAHDPATSARALALRGLLRAELAWQLAAMRGLRERETRALLQ